MASLMLTRASSSVWPWLTQPGIAGHDEALAPILRDFPARISPDFRDLSALLDVLWANIDSFDSLAYPPIMTLAAIVSTMRKASTDPSPARLRRLKEAADRLAADPLVGTVEAARLLGVSSPNTIKNWLNKKGFVRARRTPGGQWRFRLSDILAVKSKMEATEGQRSRRQIAVAASEADSDEFN